MNKIIFILILSCILLSQPICFSQCNSEQFPGCLLECKTFSENAQIFELDNSGTTPDCDNSQHKYWFQITAEESTLTIFNIGGANCFGQPSFEFDVRVFDENQLPVSDCKSFTPNSVRQSLEITNTVPGNNYSILVSSVEAKNCELNLLIEGHHFEELSNTPDIQIAAGSGNRFGKLVLPFIPAATGYSWISKNPQKTRLEKLPAANEIEYFNNGGAAAEICVVPYNTCETGEEKCISLPFLGCPNGSENFPGCLLECEDVSILGSDLSVNYSPNNLPDCNDFNLQRGFWTSVIAKDTFLKITQNSYSLNFQIAIQIFDKNQNPLIDCQNFDYSPGKVFDVENLQPGAEYSIFIGCEEMVSDNFEIDLLIEGHEIKQSRTPDIHFVFGSDNIEGYAYLDASTEPRTVIWDFSGDIVSGQGTDTIFYKKTAPDNRVCVNVITSTCGKSAQVCEIAAIVPTGFNTPPCLPVAGGIPAQNDAPGCTLCGPIYQGSTVGFTSTSLGDNDFPCGTIDNNQFISIVADSSGELSATILASNCQNNQGVQLIIFDPSFTPVSTCFSSGGTNLPGNVQASNLLPGQTYFIMIDGFAGDQCDILITTSGGVNTGPSDPPGEMTISPDTAPLCPGAIVTYSIEPVYGASVYEWVIPGNGILVGGGGDNDLFAQVEYTAPGGGVIRVTPSNACFPGIPAIEPVVVLPILPTLKPSEFICQDDYPIIRDGNIFATSGSHEITYKTGLGCDSLVTYIFVPAIQIPNLIDTMICDGGSIQIGNQIFTESTNARIELPPPFNQANGCDSIVILNLKIGNQVNSNFLISDQLCAGEPIEIIYTDSIYSTANFNWNYGGGRLVGSSGDRSQIVFDTPGIYDISLQIEDEGCISDLTTKTIIVNEKLADPIIFCNTTLTSATFSWLPVLGATQYRVDVISGQTGQLNGTEFFVSGLSPNEEVTIEVSAVSFFDCGNGVSTVTCIAQDCPNLNISIEPLSPVCLDRNAVPIQLTPKGTGQGSLQWFGDGVSNDGIFNPMEAGIGIHDIEMNYSLSTCNYRARIFIEVIPPPTADFEIEPVVCVDKNVAVRYIGNAPVTADFQWDFPNADIKSGFNSGPFELKFQSAGDFDISLTVDENNCISETIIKNTIVKNPEPAPVVICTPDKNKVHFEWDQNPDVDSYGIFINGVSIGNQLNANFTSPPLADGEAIELKVVANVVSVCDNPFTILKCNALICPPINIEISGIPDVICEGENYDLQLTATANSATSFTSCDWTGSGISSDGIFNPSTLSADMNHAVRATCLNGLCEYDISKSFEIQQKPTIEGEILSPIWHPGAFGDIDISIQNGTAPYNFSWTNGDTTEDLTNVPRGQQYCLEATDDNGCIDQACYSIGKGTFRIKPITVICQKQGVQLPIRPGRGASFSWSPSVGLSCDNCANPTVNPSKSTIYEVTATFSSGRTSSTNVIVIVIPEGFCPSRLQLENINQRYASDELNLTKKELVEIEKEITESLSKNDISVAPNPTTGQVKISSVLNIKQVEIFDFSGKVIFNKNDFSKNANTNEIDLSDFAKGIYFFKIKTTGHTVLKRVVLI